MGHADSGTTLREEIGVAQDPDFELKLLPGWTRRTADDADLKTQEDALRKRFMESHRPDLYAHARAMLRESHDAMRRAGAIAYYVATEDSEETLWIPGSIVVSLQRPPTGGTLDDLVRLAISKHGATPLFDDKRFIRFEQERNRKIQGGTITQTTINYLTPVPGSHRRRALQIAASFGRPVDVPSDDEKVRALKFAFDACVSTLRWRSPAES